MFVSSLRVSIKVDNGEHSYYDSLDLYSARGRAAFTQATARAMGIEVPVVAGDLIHILEYLEQERDAAWAPDGRRDSRELNAEERDAALDLLRDPRLCSRITDDLTTLGYVGDEINKLLVYLCATSRKMDNPMSVLILSQSASGKSYLVDTVRRLIPPQEAVAVTSLSDQALQYADNLVHKFLILGEAVHNATVDCQVRELLSGKELSRLVTVRDPETARLTSQVVRVPVIVASVMGSTRAAIHPENASRYFVIHADESREQTERIHEHQRRNYGLERVTGGGQVAERILRQHHAAQRLLSGRHIVNDMAPFLDFPAGRMRTRRDHDRFLDLIAAVCFLRQYQKREEEGGGLTFIRCDLEDYRIAYDLMVGGVLPHTLDDLPAGAGLFYEEVRRWVRGEAERRGVAVGEVLFSQRQARESLGLGHTWVKGNLKKLVEYEYLESRGGGERRKTYYRLKADEALAGVNLSMIPPPGAVEAAMTGGLSFR
jgi:hypothetical protein